MRELVVAFSAVRDGEGWGGGVVVTDVATARAVQESGHVLSEARGEGDATYRLLLQVLDVIEPLGPADVELRCGSQALVQELTGGGAVEGDAVVEGLFEQATMRLLQLGLWRIRCVEAAELRRPTELAEAALSEAADVVEREAATAGPAEASGPAVGDERVQRWVVAFAEDAGPRCPAGCRAGQRFGFGPDTPAGFCVHAMAAVVEDGPLVWSDAEQRRMTTVCPRCDVPMDIEVVE